MFWACVRQGSIFLVLWSERSNGKCAKLHTVTASNNRDHQTRSLYYCLFAPHIYGCCSSHTSRTWWIAQSTQTPTESFQQHPLLFTTNRTDPTFFFEGCSWHHLHILVTAPLCLQSESPNGKCTRLHNMTAGNNRDHTSCSFILCLFVPHIYVGVVFHAHLVCGESHIQHSANREVVTLAARLGWT